MPSISVGCQLDYEVRAPTVLLLNVAIVETPRQSITNEHLVVTPDLAAVPFLVGNEGNRFHRLSLEPGTITVRYDALATLNPLVDQTENLEQRDYSDLPPDVLPYLNASRYCESDRLAPFAISEFGQLPPDYQRVQTVCDWIHEKVVYQSGSTNSLTTACDVLIQRHGVCRDFAHLAITFCRALGIPARYVSGYASRLQPPDFHGFFEAYLSDRWYLFDATRLAPPAGMVRIAAGRDAADTAFATIWGSVSLNNIKVWADDHADTAQVLDGPPDELAVSTSN